jgi:hypothetical protein
MPGCGRGSCSRPKEETRHYWVCRPAPTVDILAAAQLRLYLRGASVVGSAKLPRQNGVR